MTGCKHSCIAHLPVGAAGQLGQQVPRVAVRCLVELEQVAQLLPRELGPTLQCRMPLHDMVRCSTHTTQFRALLIKVDRPTDAEHTDPWLR